MIHFNRNHISINSIKFDDFIKKRNENNLPNYSKKSEQLISKILCAENSIIKLTNSCTSALEFVSQIADFGVNDEIILPSYTFVSSANPFVLRGSTPVFVDIAMETMNLDPKKVELAINKKTKAILFVHYAGFGQNIEEIAALAKKYNLLLIEDAAQAIGSFYNKRALGTFGDFACFSFHSTKNISCGEGGCVVVNNRRFFKKVNIVYDKGTNRQSFFEGEVRKYQWLSKGSSYPVSEYTSFFLYNELLQEKKINTKRRAIWNQYYKSLKKLDTDGFQLPQYDSLNFNNGHIFFITVKNVKLLKDFEFFMRKNGIQVLKHYVPLHSSKAGKKYCITPQQMPVTNKFSKLMVRLPINSMLSDHEVKKVINKTSLFFSKI